MDAKEISKKVRDYFYEVHGQYGVFNFRIENVLYDKHGSLWTVECSFLTSMMATEKDRVCYKVIVDSKGHIENISKAPAEDETDETLVGQIKKLKESRKISR